MATLNIKNLPDELYERIRSHARKQHRSISQEVIHALTMHLSQSHEHSIMDLQGLGKELWIDVDASEYVAKEREAWD